METVGNNIEKMQELINTPLTPPADWVPNWQVEAEHLLHLAHEAKDNGDIERLKEIDAEAGKMVDSRESKTSSGNP